MFIENAFWKETASLNALAKELHGSTQAADAFTFQSLKDHVEEIRGLLAQEDPHWKAETIDLIIHGYLLLRRHGVAQGEIKEIMQKRLGRFREKITGALREKG